MRSEITRLTSMNPNKNKTGSNQDLYRVCPSKLTKHELEDLYFTVLEVNMQLRKTVNEQQDKITAMSTKIQRNYSAQKVFQAEERKNCCTATSLKIKQQKESIDALRRAHERAAERIRNLNAKLSSGNQFGRMFLHDCSYKNGFKYMRYTPSTIKRYQSPGNNKRVDSACAQTNPSLTGNSKDIATAETQTELALYLKDIEDIGTQTELARDKRLQSAEIQTELLRNKGLESIDTQTELSNVNTYKCCAMEEDAACCKEQRCRTQMDELKQKINNLVEELAKTHDKYSARISRLEVEVQKCRNENLCTHLENALAGDDADVSDGVKNHLMSNMGAAESHNGDLKIQLAIEKRKVAELVSLLRNAKLRNRSPKDVAHYSEALLQETKKSEICQDHDASTWNCNCGPHCPNEKPTSKHICTLHRIHKRGINVACCKKEEKPYNSHVPNAENSTNAHRIPDVVDRNNSNQLPTTETIQISTNTANDANTNDENLCNSSKPTPDCNRNKGLLHIYHNPNQNRVSVPDSLFDKRNTCIVNKIKDFPKTERMQQGQNNNAEMKGLETKNVADRNNEEYSPDLNIFSFNKALLFSDDINNCDLNNSNINNDLINSGKDTCESQETKDLSSSRGCITLCGTNNEPKPEVNLMIDTNSTQPLETTALDVNEDNNNNDYTNQQRQSCDRCLSNLSEAYRGSDKPSPSLVVKSLIEINEEQFKTIAELRRQINMRSIQDAKVNETPCDNVNDSTMPRTSIALPEEAIDLQRFLIKQGQTPSNDKNETENLKCNLNKPTIVKHYIQIPEETIALLRMLKDLSNKYGGNVYTAPNAELHKTDSDETTITAITERDPQNSLVTEDIQEESKVDINSTVHTNAAINCDTVPGNNKDVPKKLNDSILSFHEPVFLNIEPTTIKLETTAKVPSAISMNNINLQTGGNLKTDTDIQIAIMPEKLENQNSIKDTSSVPTTVQREVATYRRNSGTLCFKTVATSKRSQHCQCNEQFNCEGLLNKCIQIEKEFLNMLKFEHGSCKTGCSKCTRNFERRSLDAQVPTNANLMAPSTTVSSYEKRFANKLSDSLTNYMNGKQYVENNKETAISEYTRARNSSMPPTITPVTSARLSRIGEQLNKVKNQYYHKLTAPDCSKNMQQTLDAISEELARCKQLLSERNQPATAADAQITLGNKVSDEVLSEFDTGRHYTLKHGQAMHAMNENNSAKCAFVLHIGTVVLSDEAVLTFRGKSLVLTWKFYDQETTMTHMRAGRVVVFDFSTEYDLRLTDEFLSYMKHNELEILICDMEQPNKPIASCVLPLRDALLNTNRRADMSLALVAGPEMINARQMNNAVSDILDAGDEMGVLDLWCMLRLDGQFLQIINEAIAKKSPLNLGLDARDRRNEKLEMDVSSVKTFQIVDKKSEPSALHRWGSSVLRLPSREVSAQGSVDRSRTTDGPDDDKSTERKSKAKKKDVATPQSTKSAAIQHNNSMIDGVIINEVIANIKTSDDMKRVMRRSSLHQDPKLTAVAEESTPMTHTSTQKPAFSSKSKIVDQDRVLSSQEPTIILPTSSTSSKRSDFTDLNRKYDNIANLYSKLNSEKNEGEKLDQSRKQVTINANQRKYQAIHQEVPQKEHSEEEEQIIEITILWLALNEECEAMLNPRVQRVYVAYEFLGRSGADLETPVSLPKPRHYVDKCYFNFKKSFHIEKHDMPLLGQLARCRATSQISKSVKDCVVFSVISEPPEDPLGLEICEDIGYAYLFLGDLLAYSNGSSGYTEVIPVRSRSGTSVCGVLAVRLDGLDVLRQSISLVDFQSMTPRID